jgi:hypothetical protein
MGDHQYCQHPMIDSIYITEREEGILPTLKRYFEYSYTMSDKNQEIEKNVSEQAGVEGQRKEVNVEDYPKAIALGQLLKDIDFPADKQKVIQHVQQRSGNNADGQNILSVLQNIEDKQYHNVAEVTKAAGVVYT